MISSLSQLDTCGWSYSMILEANAFSFHFTAINNRKIGVQLKFRPMATDGAENVP